MSKTLEYLNLKKKNDIKIVKINGKDVEVIQYLSASEKGSLVAITLQESMDDSICNPIKKEIFFEMNLVLVYSDLKLTEEEKVMDLFELYDILETNDVIDKIIAQIPAEEYNQLRDYIQEWEQKLEKYNLSMSATISSIINNLPAQAQAAADIVENFDKEKYGEVVNFAKAIGAKI